MKKLWLYFASFPVFFLCSLTVCAQGGFTTVTGTVKDPNGITWACGTISAQLVTAGGAAPTLNGGGFTTQTSPVQLGCPTIPGSGASGSFVMRLADSGVISPSNTTWRFTVGTTGTPPPLGTGPQSFTYTTAINCSTNTPTTCTSNQLDISTPINALAPAIGAGGGVSPTPGVFQSSLDPPLYQNYSLTTTGAQAGINLTATPIDTHTISWRPSGTVSTCAVQVDTSPDGTTWASAGAIPSLTCTSPGQFSTASPVVANYVRVNLTTLTGGGTLTVVYSGRLAQSPFSEGGGGPTIPCAGSPTGFVIKQGDYIIQNDTGYVGGATFTLTYRMILATGERKEFQQAVLPGAAGNGPAYNSFQLPEGCLTAVSLTLIGGSVDSGQTVAQVFVGRNFSPVPNASSTQILACQLSSNYSCGWPGTWRAPTDGQGLNQSCTITNPAAGANLSQNINTGTLTCNGVSGMIGQKHWLSNIRFTLTTDANAAARQVCIKLTNGNGNGDYGYCMQATQAASTIVTYDFTAGVGPTFLGGASLTVIPTTNVAGTANEVQGTLPSNFQYFDATVLSTRITNIQVGDQLSAIVVRTFWSHHATD